jgi:TetR/AcrR family transcriptional regulator, regulator of autoinduction and epiphytic fitness
VSSNAEATEAVSRGDRKRAEIVAAAERQFLEFGFAAASMDRIAAAAGASKRTVYNHFASKAELFRAVIERLYGESLNRPEGMPPPGAPLAEALTAIARRVLDHIGNPRVRAMIRLIIAESVHSPEIARIYSTTGKDPGIQRIAGWVAAEVAAGRLAAGRPTLAAEQFLGCLKEAVVWPRLLGLEPEVPEDLVVAEAVQTFLARFAVKGLA